MPLASQNTDAMTFPADGTDFAFFGAEQDVYKRQGVHFGSAGSQNCFGNGKI